MPAVKKATATDKGYGQAVVVEKMKSHANDPYVVEKVKKAKAMVSKIDFTDYLAKK
jgi:hypothetical protein